VRLLQRLPIAKYSGACIILWGAVLALFSVVHDFAGAAVIRVFLGAFEAAVTPGFALITSQWYKTSEQGARTAIWFSFNGFAQIFGGLVAYGIAVSRQDDSHGLALWKILFLFTGLLTVVLGVLFLILVPDNQLNARWLNEQDRVLAVARVRENQQGIGNKHFKKYQFVETLKDPLVWAFVFYGIAANIPNGGITNFFSQLIVSFGYTPTHSLLLGTPAGAVEVVTLLFCGWYGDRYQKRLLVSLVGLSIAILGAILLVALPDSAKVGKLVGYYLTLAGPAPFVALLSLISSNVAGYTKKTTVAGMYLIFYCVGNIVGKLDNPLVAPAYRRVLGPQTFRPQDAPRYIPAIIAILVCYVLCVVDVLFIWWYCQHMNRKKAAFRALPSYVKLENSEYVFLLL
jgi:MFS transporter, ACS family, allantoate permease